MGEVLQLRQIFLSLALAASLLEAELMRLEQSGVKEDVSSGLKVHLPSLPSWVTKELSTNVIPNPSPRLWEAFGESKP